MKIPCLTRLVVFVHLQKYLLLVLIAISLSGGYADHEHGKRLVGYFYPKPSIPFETTEAAITENDFVDYHTKLPESPEVGININYSDSQFDSIPEVAPSTLSNYSESEISINSIELNANEIVDREPPQIQHVIQSKPHVELTDVKHVQVSLVINFFSSHS